MLTSLFNANVTVWGCLLFSVDILGYKKGNSSTHARVNSIKPLVSVVIANSCSLASHSQHVFNMFLIVKIFTSIDLAWTD